MDKPWKSWYEVSASPHRHSTRCSFISTLNLEVVQNASTRLAFWTLFVRTRTCQLALWVKSGFFQSRDCLGSACERGQVSVVYFWNSLRTSTRTLVHHTTIKILECFSKIPESWRAEWVDAIAWFCFWVHKESLKSLERDIDFVLAWITRSRGRRDMENAANFLFTCRGQKAKAALFMHHRMRYFIIDQLKITYEMHRDQTWGFLVGSQ